MGRKKKISITESDRKNDSIIKINDGNTFIPSEYQKAIFNYIEHESGNLIVEAAAGAAKTTTMIKSIDLLPNDKMILFVAFNVDIVKDIKQKINKAPNIDVRTLHSLGYKILQKELGIKQLKIDNFKYISYIQQNAFNLSLQPINKLSTSEYKSYCDNINNIVNFGRFNLCETIEELKHICDLYSIECIADETNIALLVMNWGKQNYETIDFTDMIWLPNALLINNKTIKYDYIFLDEAQDSNLCEFELIKKCLKMGSRFIACGDKNQSIYSFSGSSPDIIDKFKLLPNTISLPLSISYRCPKTIIDFVHSKFKDIAISPKEDAEYGNIYYDKHITDINDGDTVLCRTNAPLTKVYTELLKQNKQAYILGKDIGDNLIKMIKNTKAIELNKNLHKDGLFLRLYNALFFSRDKLCATANIDPITASNSPEIINKFDAITTLEILSDKINSTNELIEKIKFIFSDKDKNGIKLSTIHKSKGLTLNNVFICCPSLIPSKRAKQQWEIQQEKNLEYVCYTRTKNNLSFMSEEGFEYFLNGKSEEIYHKLKDKEIIINLNHGKRNNDFLPVKNNYKEIIKNKTEIISSQINKININNKNNKQTSLLDLQFNKKQNKKIKL